MQRDYSKIKNTAQIGLQQKGFMATKKKTTAKKNNQKKLNKLIELLKSIRIASGHSQRSWAKKLNISYSYVAQVERGRAEMPIAYILLHTKHQRELCYLAICESIKKQLEV